MKKILIILVSFGVISCVGGEKTRTTVVIVDKSFNKIPAKYQPQTTQLATIKSKKLNKKSNKKSANTLWIKPINATVFRGFSKKNQGIIFNSTPNLGVVAVNNGSVVYSGNSLKSYGYMVIIKHKYGFYSQYMFNKKSLVSVGDEIKQGQKIAITGKNKFYLSMKKFTTIVNPANYINL